MNEQYFVLYDWNGSPKSGVHDYGELKEFGGLEEAIACVREHLSERPVLGMAYGTYGVNCRPKDIEKPYLIAAGTRHWNELSDHDYSYMTYQVARCAEPGIEETMDLLTKKGTDKMYVGLEVCLFPQMKTSDGGA